MRNPEKFTTRKNILLPVMKRMYGFADPQNPSAKRQFMIAYFLVFTRK